MKLTTIKRTQKVARHGTKAWLFWRTARRLAPSSPEGHSTAVLAGVAATAAVGGFALAKLAGSRHHEHHEHLDHLDHDHSGHDHDHHDHSGHDHEPQVPAAEGANAVGGDS